MGFSRDFRLIWVGYTLSALGDMVIPAALALAVVRATGSAAALALVLGCASIPRLMLLPLGGVLADRWSPRRVAIVADLVRGAAQLVVGVELVAGHFRLVDLAVAGVVTGAASAFALPTGSRLVVASVAPADRPRANGFIGASRAAAGVLGPAIGGAVVLTIGPGWAFLIDATTFGVSAVAFAAARLAFTTPATAPAARTPLHRDLTDGWAEVRRHDWLWTSLIGHGVWNMAAALFMTLGPLIAVRSTGGEAVWIAVLQAGAIGLLVGSLFATRLGSAGRFRLRIARPVLFANLALSLYSVPLALFAVGAPPVALVAAYGVALAGLGFLNPVWESTLQQRIPASHLARVDSWDMVLSFGAMPLGYALAAPAAAALGNGGPLAIAAVVVAAATAGLAVVPGVRRLRYDHPPRDDLAAVSPARRAIGGTGGGVTARSTGESERVAVSGG
ncbi:MAG TPA: MFS transporter [Asanoa sp.]